jgi:hypothetical protein
VADQRRSGTLTPTHHENDSDPEASRKARSYAHAHAAQKEEAEEVRAGGPSGLFTFRSHHGCKCGPVLFSPVIQRGGFVLGVFAVAPNNK